MVAGMLVRRTTVRRCRTSAAGLAGSSAAVVRRGRDATREVRDHQDRATVEREVAAAEVREKAADVAVVVHRIQ